MIVVRAWKRKGVGATMTVASRVVVLLTWTTAGMLTTECSTIAIMLTLLAMLKFFLHVMVEMLLFHECGKC